MENKEQNLEETGVIIDDSVIDNSILLRGSIDNLTPLNNSAVNQELTFGQKAVGLTFNPSGDENVNFVKQRFAEIIDNLEETHKVYSYDKQPSWVRNVSRTAAFNAVIAAKMAVVNYLTLED